MIWKEEDYYMIGQRDRGTIHLFTAAFWAVLGLLTIWFLPLFGILFGGIFLVVAFLVFVDAMRTRAIYDNNSGREYIGVSKIDVVLEFLMPWLN